MTLKERLESHPVRNLVEIIKGIKSEVAPSLALSKNKKRHTKTDLVSHILKLDKLNLLGQDIPMYVKPKRASKPKVSASDLDKSVSSMGKEDQEKLLEGLKEIPDKPKKVKKPRVPSAWNKYVKKMGGVKKAAADKSGFEAFKKSL